MFSTGLLVSMVIFRQGLGLFLGAFGDLTDAGVSPKTRQSLLRALDPLLPSSQPSSTTNSTFPNGDHVSPLLSIRHLRAKRTGSLMFVDLTADVSGSMSVEDASALDDKITESLKKSRREISEVRVKFHPVDVGPTSHVVRRSN
jgi:divalent metal cation (Fe/Co/Zn/Cd) transporter